MKMHFEAFWKDLERQRSKLGRSARSLVVLRRSPSSHQLARRLLREYAAEESDIPVIDVIAWEQTAGHGREGRSWASPAGAGIYASLVRPIEAATVPRLPMLIPVALAELLNSRLEGRCRIKWPNDLVVDGDKLGGVLIDVIAQGESRGTVISFGVNTAPDLSVFAQEGATSLFSLGVEPELLPDLAVALIETVGKHLASSAGDFLERYRELSAHQAGDAVRWRHRDRVVEGTFLGFDEGGRLRLRIGEEESLISAGDLISAGGVAEEAAVAEPDVTADADG